MTGNQAQLRVSVIIPHYSDLAALDLCLAALRAQTFAGRDFEIVVADNDSPEGEAAVAKVVAGRARLVVAPTKGAGPARNAGVAVASGKILAFIDSDCVAEPGWLEAGVRALADWDFVGGRVKVLVEDPARPTAAEAMEKVFAFDFKRYITKKGFAGSGNLFCRRAVFEAVGGFRVGVSEDIDWSHRATTAGYRLGYAPDAIVGHPGRRTWPDLKFKCGRIDAETYGLMKGRRAARLSWLFWCLKFPAAAIFHTPRVLLTRELSGLGQRAAALTIYYRLCLWRCVDCLRLLVADEVP